MSLISLDFEVYGKVQGVFFRKLTCEQAKTLGLRGWCRNTALGTVEGILEGSSDKVEIMKDWLRYKGSPKSKIEKVEFRNEKALENFTFNSFGVKK